MEGVGKLVLLIGAILVVAGGVMFLLGRLGLSSMPGDISFKTGNLRVFIPIGTSILLSIILTILLNVLIRR